MLQTDLSSFSYKKGSLVPFCKRCGEQNFHRNGKNTEGIQRYKCKHCGMRFVWTSDLPKRRCFSNIMSFAVELYTDLRKAISLKGIAELLKKIFNVQVSYEAIRQWVLVAKTAIPQQKCTPGPCWHIDETYIKIKGGGYWLWIVYDKQLVLAWHLSKRRTIIDARKVLLQAVTHTKTRPEQIITDGLRQYCYAISKEIGWNWREQKKRHIVSSGIGKNAFIERLNREIKRRLKWFNTFQSRKGALAFFGLWFFHYNQRKATHIT